MTRTLLLKARTGSHNYDLATKGSDEDFKEFVAPTFEDLYKGKMFADSIITNVVDRDIHDIRKLPDLLWKSNIAYLELLFSNYIWYADEHYVNFHKLFDMKDDIARINLPQLFKSCGGMYLNRMKKLDHATEGTQELFDAYGYNTKEALHTYRTLDLLVKFEANGFKDFDKALRYSGEDRSKMLAIKHGIFTKEAFIEFITAFHDKCFAPLKEKYCNNKPDEELRDYIGNIVMSIVEKNMATQLLKN